MIRHLGEAASAGHLEKGVNVDIEVSAYESPDISSVPLRVEAGPVSFRLRLDPDQAKRLSADLARAAAAVDAAIMDRNARGEGPVMP